LNVNKKNIIDYLARRFEESWREVEEKRRAFAYSTMIVSRSTNMKTK